MPKVNVQKQVDITLILSPKEALWLKNVMQNPVGPENSEDYSMRNGFFESLPGIPELQAIVLGNGNNEF